MYSETNERRVCSEQYLSLWLSNITFSPLLKTPVIHLTLVVGLLPWLRLTGRYMVVLDRLDSDITDLIAAFIVYHGQSCQCCVQHQLT